jgi:hypothetical protein
MDEETVCGVCERSLEGVQSDAILRKSSSSLKPAPRKRKTRVSVVLFGFLVAATVFGLALFLLASSTWRTVGFAVGMMGLILTIVVFLRFGREYEEEQSRTIDPHGSHGGFGPGSGPSRVKDNTERSKAPF